MSAPAPPLVSGVVPALLTPFAADGTLNLEVIDPLVEKLLADGASGFFVTGNTGEGFACTPAERKQVVERSVRVVNRRVPIIAHVGAAGGTEASCDLAQHAEQAGADAVSSVVPPEAPGDVEAAVAHFTAIGKSCALPFYVYHFSSASMDAEDFLTRMKEVPNFAGIKFTSKDFYCFEQLIAHKQRICGGAPLNALTGPDEMAVAGRAMGADGCIGSTYNVQCRTYVEIYKAFDRGDVARARELQVQANKVIAILIRICNCAERGLNISEGLKCILTWQGLPCGQQRQGKRFTPAEQAQLRRELTEAVKGEGVVDTFGLLDAPEQVPRSA